MAGGEGGGSGSSPLSIVASGLTRRYGPIQALDRIDLRLAKADFLTVLGPNGAGKTTLLKLFACLLRPTSGSLQIFGLDPAAAPDAVKRRVGMIGHASLLYAGLTARDNLLFYGRLYDVDRPAARAQELLVQVGLSPRADDLVRTFSSGMTQRLAIARALIHDPDLLLLDEPYAGLDREACRILSGILRQERERGRTLVMVTHRTEEALEVSTRFAVLARGRLTCQAQAEGASREALERLYRDGAGEALS